MNSTNTAAKPGSMNTIIFTRANGQITYNLSSSTAQSTVVPSLAVFA